MKAFKCTECDVAYGTLELASKCHYGIGGVIESTQDVNARNRMIAVRRIVSTCSYSRIEDLMIDLTTARAILAVYENLSPDTQDRFAAMPMHRMADTALRLIK